MAALPEHFLRPSSDHPVSRWQEGLIVGALNLKKKLNLPLTVDQIAEAAAVDRSTVYRVAARASQPHRVTPRMAALAEKHERVLEAALPLVYEHPDWKPERLHSELPVHIRALVRNPAALRAIVETVVPYEPSVRRPPLTDALMAIRFRFVAEFDLNLFDNVVWTDEMSADKAGDAYRWRVNDRAHYDAIRVAMAEKTMVWGGVSVRWGALPLHVWPPGTNVSADVYLRDIVLGIILPWLHGIPEPERKDVVLMQDGARVHWTAEVRAILQAAGVTLLEWPAHSPDLNMIEMVWGRMKGFLKVCGDVSVAEGLRQGWIIHTQALTIRLLKAKTMFNWEQCLLSDGGNKHKTM